MDVGREVRCGGDHMLWILISESSDSVLLFARPMTSTSRWT